ATRTSRRFSLDGPEGSWEQTPWGRLLVGLLLAQGLYFVLRHFWAAGLIAALGEGIGDVWATLTGLIVLQSLQAVSVLAGGMLTGAGQRRGIFFGGVMGVWNGVFSILVQNWLGNPLTSAGLFGEPLLQAAMGAFGGLIGSLIWKPLPTLTLPTDS